MTKWTPHYKLAAIQTQMTDIPAMGLTGTAATGIREYGLNKAEALRIVRGLTRQQFQKSMTCDNDHKVWQDVYRVEHEEMFLYVKFQKRTDGTNGNEFFVISFKEWTED